jgi:hypothetical protein
VFRGVQCVGLWWPGHGWVGNGAGLGGHVDGVDRHGSVVGVELHPGSVDDYNRNVAGLREQAGNNSAMEAQQAAVEEAAEEASHRMRVQQADLRDKQDAIAAAADTVTAGNRDLRAALARPPSLVAFSSHLRDAQNDYAATRKNIAIAAVKSEHYEA